MTVTGVHEEEKRHCTPSKSELQEIPRIDRRMRLLVVSIRVMWCGQEGMDGRGSDDGESSEEYDSDYIYDGISPPGEW